MHVPFSTWTRRRRLASITTNAGADALPFQTWHHFKEAFAPEVVAQVVDQCEIPVQRCLDPFAGSGTSALASQFLGIHPITIEINPFLADLTEAKLVHYDADHLVRDIASVLRRVDALAMHSPTHLPNHLPPTFIEPGRNDRWVFNRHVATRIFQYRQAIEDLSSAPHRRLLRVLLGGCLVNLSNVVVNGKGRRYRKRWKQRTVSPTDVDRLFAEAAYNAATECSRFAPRAHPGYTVIRGDSRRELSRVHNVDLAIFSPPYPNSFDYTDIYNIELWMLGYLTTPSANRALRTSTLSSHVQLHRDYAPPPSGSRHLDDIVCRLETTRSQLWNRWIPEMIGAYFADMLVVLQGVSAALAPHGYTCILVGDSRYAGVLVPTASVLADLAPRAGLRVTSIEPSRSIRTSAQQGGLHNLREQFLTLKKCPPPT